MKEELEPKRLPKVDSKFTKAVQILANTKPVTNKELAKKTKTKKKK
ncbi:MAG: hypothetical protein ACREGG_02250 [Candidatus Saccharimonadales bacterium]